MICPECKRPTKRLVYDRRGKRCPDCNNPNFLRILEMTPPAPQFVDHVSRMHEIIFAAQNPKPPPLETLRCVITPNPAPFPPADAYARYHSYRRGWEAGAVARVKDPAFTQNANPTMREEYERGFEAGTAARREMHVATCERTGYQPTILREQ